MPGLLFLGRLSPRSPPAAAFGGEFWGYAFASALGAARGGFSTPQRNGAGRGAPSRAKHHPHTLLGPEHPHTPSEPSPAPRPGKGREGEAGMGSSSLAAG